MRIASKLSIVAFALGLSTLALSGSVAAQNAKVGEVNIGDPAPVFESIDDQGKPWKSTDHVGKKVVVLYFYPADFTGGCTKQACSFRDDMGQLTGKGVEVVGISGDTAPSHALFKKHHQLNFTLLADEDGSVAKKFGVPLAKGGEVKVKDLNTVIKQGVRAARWTFVIGKDGKVLYKNTKVNAAEDSKDILKVLASQTK
jgi:peroxiredoxin Q/BCP